MKDGNARKEKISKIKKKIEENNVKSIELNYVDLLGEVKTIGITADDIDNAFRNTVAADGSSVKGFSLINLADVKLKPDANSFRIVPYYENKYGSVATIMCDILGPNGKPSPGCSRTNLKDKLSEMNLLGFSKMNLGFELEFFLFKNKPVIGAEKDSLVDTGSYCASRSHDAGTDVRWAIMHELNKMGAKCATNHHEAAFSQNEVTFEYADALRACDDLILAKELVRKIAKDYGFEATFMPKPLTHLAGSGLHTNVSLMIGDNNAFANGKNKGISDTAKHFIAGVLTHARGLSFLTNPTINSYKRLGSHEAPSSVCWSFANRSAMVRVPIGGDKAARAELRNPDCAGNIYLKASGILASGLDGINRGIPHFKAVNENAYNLSAEKKRTLNINCLPSNLADAMHEFKRDEVVYNSIGKKKSKLLIDYKTAEINKYYHKVNSFDLEHYFGV